MLLVTGPNGVIGSAVVAELLAREVAFKVLVRDPAKVAQLPANVVRVVGELGDTSALQEAFRGVTRAFLLSPVIDPARFGRTLAAAEAAGIEHIVKLSTLEAGYGNDGIARWHRAEELQIEASGLAWTFVRPGNFSSNALHWSHSIRREGKVYAATGHGKSAPIDPSDIAAVIVHALTQAQQSGQSYQLTGPELWNVAEQTQILARVLGKPLSFIAVDPDSAGAELRQYGAPDVMVAALIELWKQIAVDDKPVMTNTVSQLLGRPAGTFEQWAEAHRYAFA
jgi:uncharacterized protein YbjT (DUF2867 family)